MMPSDRQVLRFRRIDGIIERQNLRQHVHRLRMNRIKPYIKTFCIAASLFVLDAFILNQGFVAVILILLALFVFFPMALPLRRRDRRKYEQRLVKIAIYVLTGVAVLSSNMLQNRLADRRAIAIGNACLAYRAKYHQYPTELNDLVPEFLPSVPNAKWNGERFRALIMSPCCFMKLCRLLDDASTIWSLDHGDFSTDQIRRVRIMPSDAVRLVNAFYLSWVLYGT